MMNLLGHRRQSALETAVEPLLLTTAGYLSLNRRRTALLAIAVLLATGGGSWLVLRYGLIPPLVLLTSLLLAAIFWQPRLGVYVLFALVLLFEAGGPDDLMLPGRYLNFGLQSSFGVSGFIASPLELLLLFSFGSWAIQGIARRNLRFRMGSLAWPLVLFYLALLGGIVRGTLAGGDAYIAFWEARALLYVLLCYLVASNTIENTRHVTILTGITLLAVGAFAIEGAYRHIVLVNTVLSGIPEELVYTHDTVIFLGTELFLVLALWIYRSPAWQRLLGLALAPVTLFTLLATQRRAGYIALLVALLALALVLAVTHRKAFGIVILPLLIGTSIYLPIFWNNTGLLGQPARAVRSLSQPDARDASSNEYRALEKVNVIETIHSDPLLGVGFGREFHFVVPLPSLSWWEFWHYEPHHNIMWVWLKTGAPGFIAFWILMCSTVAYAAAAIRTSPHPSVKIFGVLALVGIIQTLVFCYVDLGLVDGRVTVFLGTLMGTVGILRDIQA